MRPRPPTRRRLAGALAACLALGWAGIAQAGDTRSGAAEADTPPTRVVSLNLCTDQLAMMMAGPDQLVSVSYLASDPRSSVMHEEARQYPVNQGQAEEVFLLDPDLVVAGSYSKRQAVAMLRRLGFRVEQFSPASSFDDIRANVRRMGALLGRERQANQLIADFDARLDAVRDARQGQRPVRAIVHGSNNYTSGRHTLVQEVLEAAGMRNVADELGYSGLARLPLELMVMAEPDAIISGNRFTSPALAQEDFRHPALDAFAHVDRTQVGDYYWICGTPATVRAVELLSQTHQTLAATDQEPGA
ncbi:ABC transporter substrate-binding protein [Rhodothalassium salexigens]|uniref:ABC transporter substrate-binding protein n=1 Tax=Rhodothalassium salexigens TaxID=1086 RepID=UPI0014054808|nr:ABC transporter substrate-binding protein [Rhodothalassium salexigens]